MTMRRWMATLVVVLAVTGMVPAGAAGEPQVSDACGAEGIAAEPTAGATTPWTDICSAEVSTLPGGSGLKITATFAAEIPDDRIGIYAVGWRVGDCAYRASHETGFGEHGANGVSITDAGGNWLRVRCGEGVQVACNVVGTCTEWPSERHYGLPDAVTISGSTLAFTIPFDGDLADVGASHPAGTQLTRLRVESSTKAVLVATNPGFCYGTTCGSVGGDIAYGEGYTIGE